MVCGLPNQYIFYLICCYKKGYKHELCQAGKPANPITWHPGGPTTYQLPFPVIDAERPWGNVPNLSCKGTCAGHYKMLLVNVSNEAEKNKDTTTSFNWSFKDIASDKIAIIVAQSVLLPQNECQRPFSSCS